MRHDFVGVRAVFAAAEDIPHDDRAVVVTYESSRPDLENSQEAVFMLLRAYLPTIL